MENKSRVILVVEDEQPLLDAIKIKLEKNNFQVVTCRSVEQAKHYVNDLEKVDVIWLDHYLLGKEDGLGFLAWCKKEDNVKCLKIPVFVVSNTATPEKLSTYLELGAREYFIKSEDRLDDIVCAVIKSLDSDLDCK